MDMAPAVINLRLPLQVSDLDIATFCHKWNVTVMELFGSVLRDDFRQGSDVDVLVTLDNAAKVNLLDIIAMQDELELIFGREVDLLTRQSVEKSRNRYPRDPILEAARVIYAQ